MALFALTQEATLQLREKPISVSVTRDGFTAASSPKRLLLPRKGSCEGVMGRQTQFPLTFIIEFAFITIFSKNPKKL